MPTAIRALRAAAALMLCALACYGQGDRGLITGVVRDSTGAIIPGTAVRAANMATNVAVQAESNAQGNYSLDFLAPGQYVVSVEKEGFKRFERTDVIVRVNDRITLDIALEVGAVTEKMVVEAGAPLLETASSSLGTVIDNRRITDLPMVHGNPFILEFLSPGITFNGNVAWTRPFDGAAAEASINGSQRQSIEFQLDGVADTWRRAPAYTPSVEFIQEYKVETASYDASQGHSSGAWVNVSLKSGTNQIHGSFYDYLQNRALNANLFFNNKAGQPKPKAPFNRWGLSAGGPLVKDKTFWFFGYEGIRHKIPYPFTLTVPTMAQRGGDFSALLAAGPNYQIYDPATTTDLGNGRYSRQPFAGNIIPSNRLSPIGKNIVNYWPEPNAAGSKDFQNNYVFGQGVEPDKYYSISTRVDHAISLQQRLFGRFVVSKRTDGPYRDFFPKASGTYLFYRNRGASLDYVYTLNPQTVLNARYGYTRFTSLHDLPTEGFDITTLGLPRSLKDQIEPLGYVFPRVSPSGYRALNTENKDGNFSDIHSLAATVSRTQGRHILRTGVDARVYLVNMYSFGTSSGSYTFGNNFTNGPLDNSPAAPIGQGMAALMLGLPTGGGIDVNASSASATRYMGAFIQDDWKVTPRLTVNLGLRYEYEGAIAERFNRSVRGFDFGVASPVEAAAVANYAQQPIPELPIAQFKVKGGLTFAGVNGQPNALWSPPSHNFSPRIGFAWSVRPDTVIRAGYGIFFDALGITTQNPIQTGFSQTTSLVPTLDNGITFRATMANPFPDGILKPVGAGDGIATFLGKSVSFFIQSPRTPYNQRWSFGVQRQFWGKLVADVNYVGSRGTALLMSRQLNGTPNQYLSTKRVRDQAVIDRLSTAVPNPFYPLLPGTGLSGQTVSVASLLRPYPQFTGVSTSTNEGYSWYHSLQSRLERRFGNGFTIMGAWTWSKNMEAISLLNTMDPRPERVISPNDRTHRLVLNGIYELPFGRGRRFGAAARGLPGKVIEGWQIDAIYQIQSGDPLGLSDFLFYSDPQSIVLSAGERTPERWFNTSGFERDSRKALASNVRYQSSRFSGLRSDRINYLDFSAIKKTKITERFSADFRAEFINSLNHPVFEAPDTNPYSSTFGVVSAAKALPRTIQFGLVIRF